MTGKNKFLKAGKVLLGIVAEIAMTFFIMATALGLSWLIIKGMR